MQCRVSDKENAPGAAAPPAKPSVRFQCEGEAAGPAEAPAAAAEAEAAGAGKGRRRKKLLPSKPLSSDMRSALGEWNSDDVSLAQHAAQQGKQQAAADALAAPKGGRARRQTTFYRL